jgi:hypothetical protein
MAVQGSTLYGGSVSKAAIYEIDQGLGLQWSDYMKTEINVDRKPRQLTRAEHAGNPITENIPNPVVGDFGGVPTVTIDGRQLSVSELMVMDSFEQLTWKETFPGYQPSGLNVDLKANPQIQKVIFNRIMEAVKTQINELHSNGDSSLISPNPLRFYDGLWTQILADVDTTVVGAPTVLTSANILPRVYELRNAVDARLRFKPNLRIFCSVEDFDLYDVARRSTQTQLAETDIENNSKLPQSFGARIELVPVLGMAKNEMFATVADKTDRSNLVQGVWMDQDSETLKMFKFSEADQDWRIIMRFDMGVNYKSGKDIWYVVGV